MAGAMRIDRATSPSKQEHARRYLIQQRLEQHGSCELRPSHCDAFTKGDTETVMGLHTDDIEFHVFSRSPASASYSDKDEVLGCTKTSGAVWKNLPHGSPRHPGQR